MEDGPESSFNPEAEIEELNRQASEVYSAEAKKEREYLIHLSVEALKTILKTDTLTRQKIASGEVNPGTRVEYYVADGEIIAPIPGHPVRRVFSFLLKPPELGSSYLERIRVLVPVSEDLILDRNLDVNTIAEPDEIYITRGVDTTEAAHTMISREGTSWYIPPDATTTDQIEEADAFEEHLEAYLSTRVEPGRPTVIKFTQDLIDMRRSPQLYYIAGERESHWL